MIKRKPNTKLLIALRKKGLYQRELAEKAGLNEATISRVISGREVLDKNKQRQIARALRVSIKEVF